MNETKNKDVLDTITNFYLSSRDYNGIPIHDLAHNLNIQWGDMVDHLSHLNENELVGVVFSDTDVNPHIMRLGVEAVEIQLEKLPSADLHACVYPLAKHLEEVVDRSNYESRPYALALALGNPQLKFLPFDLSVLEIYRNDPRYSYSNDDINGRISVRSEYYDSNDLANSDHILLDTFGFCYDEDLNRAVAAYIRYLADLNPRHQQIWKAREISGEYKLHPDYYRNTVIGDWGEGISVFQAFIEEIKAINEMATAMGREPLFRKDFSDDSLPGFSFLVRPTKKEYHDFILLLDKMFSDNLNRDFFQNQVSYEREDQRRDGRISVTQKGTISILDEWLHKYYRTDDWEPIEEMIKAYKKIRRKRQKPAHKIEDNVFDQKYFHKQRKIMISAYEGIRIIRLLFASHPECSQIELTPVLDELRIWTY